jgi:lipopolysaccharide transport system ATP-binding protein
MIEMLNAITIENVSKLYRLGQIGTGTLAHDLNRLWASIRRKEDPYSRIGSENDRTTRGGDYVWALRDINLSVKQGEVLGIIGKNGAGKSTLLKLLSRVTAPTSGIIKAKGRMASLLEVGTGFHPELSGRENIFLNGAILGMTRHEIRKRLDEIIDFSGCAKYIDTPVKRFSSGMYVRLAFAVAAHLEPEILVVDEVLAVGDAEFQSRCIGKMQDVSRRTGRTILFVSHNMAAIKQLCPDSVLIQKGKVARVGDSASIISDYLKENSNSARYRRWNAEDSDRPDTPEICLEEIAVKDENGSTEAALSTESEIEVQINYTIKTPVHDLRVALLLLTPDGTEVFASSDFRSTTHNIRTTGKYSSRCKIPPYLLNRGSYIISIDFDIPMHRSIISNQRINFTVSELSKNQLGLTRAPSPAGVIHPILQWKVVSE